MKKYHPDKLNSGRVASLFNDNGIAHLRKSLKSRTKQISIDRFLNKDLQRLNKVHQANSLDLKSEKEREKKQENVPEVLMERDLPSKQ